MTNTSWDEHYDKCNKHIRFYLTILTGVIFIMCGFTLSIFDIVLGVTWKECYMNQRNANVYLVISGSLMFTTLILLPKIMQNYEVNNSSILGQFATLCGLAYVGNLIWGMIIVWGTQQNDCNSHQYYYLYYRTMVICFLTVCFIVIYVNNKNNVNRKNQQNNPLSIRSDDIYEDDELTADV